MALTSQRLPWHRLTSLHVGMGCATLWTLEEERDFQELPHSLPHVPVPLGAGTNLLGSDQGGLHLVRLAPPPMPALPEGKEGLLPLPASLPLTRLALLCAQRGLGGLAPLAGIPGTLGGAIRMNAGANGADVGSLLEEWRGVDLKTGKPFRWKRGEGGFGYRTSPVPPTVFVLQATLRLPQVEPAREREAILQELRRRREKNPQGPSAGSIFRNPPGESAGRLLEAAGCKGLRRGPLVVSDRHANWILNPTATPAKTEDALWLIREMQRRVPGLRPEVCLPGGEGGTGAPQ